MKSWDIKTIKAAALLRGYLMERDLPQEVREAVDYLTTEIDTILSDVNQILEADLLRSEREREQKRVEREEKKQASAGLKAGDIVVMPDGEKLNIKGSITPNSNERKPWSAEARAAAAERMRAMQAAKKAKRNTSGEAQAPLQGGA